ncbi:MAG: fumarylacetoacetate hydrolase family protein [Methylovirgula sp.]
MGYTLFNDGTLRDYQRKSTQWTIGKNFDGHRRFRAGPRDRR